MAHTSSTTACHTCCMRNRTGLTSQNVSTTNWESQCIAVCRTRPQSTWSTAVHQSQDIPSRRHLWSATRHHLTVPRYWLSTFGRSLLCRWSGGLELATGQSPWPGAQQQQLYTIAEDESISSLPLSTHSAVDVLVVYMLYDCYINLLLTLTLKMDHIRLYIGLTIAISCTIFEFFDAQNIVTLKSKLGVIEGHWKWHHSMNCVRVPIRFPL